MDGEERIRGGKNEERWVSLVANFSRFLCSELRGTASNERRSRQGSEVRDHPEAEPTVQGYIRHLVRGSAHLHATQNATVNWQTEKEQNKRVKEEEKRLYGWVCMYVCMYPFPIMDSERIAKKKRNTYNTRDSLVVTDPITSLAVTGLSMGERTGSRVPQYLWSYVSACVGLGTFQERKQDSRTYRPHHEPSLLILARPNRR